MYLLSGDVKYSDLSLSGKGSALWLDLSLPGTGKAVLPAHHYKAMLDEDQEMAYTFQAGIDLGAYGGVIGSFVYENNGKMEYVMVEDGTVDITLDGSTYTVDAVVKSEGKEVRAMTARYQLLRLRISAVMLAGSRVSPALCLFF